MEEICKRKPIKKCVHTGVFVSSYKRTQVCPPKYRPLPIAVLTLPKRLVIALKFNHGMKFKNHDLKFRENFV